MTTEAARGSGGARHFRVGLISDTHGRVSEEALAAFAGVDHIVHAGDIGSVEVLNALAAIAPVTAVVGNVDLSDYGWGIGDVARVSLGGVTFLAGHVKGHLLMTQNVPQRLSVVVTGHTHRAVIEKRGEVLFVNPGSASVGRGDGRSVAVAEVSGTSVSARIVPLPSAR